MDVGIALNVEIVRVVLAANIAIIVIHAENAVRANIAKTVISAAPAQNAANAIKSIMLIYAPGGVGMKTEKTKKAPKLHWKSTWTREQEDDLICAVLTGESLSEYAKKIGRTKSAVYSKLYHLQVDYPENLEVSNPETIADRKNETRQRLKQYRDAKLFAMSGKWGK
jgi:hypothetical protein